MSTTLRLKSERRDERLRISRKDPNPDVRFRAHILLLLDQGRSWTDIQAILACSSRTIDRWLKRFQQEGIEARAGRKRGRPVRFGLGWVAVVAAWVIRHTPRDFGFLRSRWTCATLVLLLREEHGLAVSRETVRRWLHRSNLVYRRPRPTVGPTDPEYQQKRDALRTLLAEMPDDETAVFQDEVEICTNPKIGQMGMLRGRQATVETPGNHEKRQVSGSIHWRTGTMILTEGKPKQGRDSAWFIQHLDELRRRLRRYKKIHVICDQAAGHTSFAVAEYVWRWRNRIQLHGLPVYSPETNPIERVWWVLHETITRNHRCRSLEELLELVFTWLDVRSPFKVEDSIYRQDKAA
jgi:putative transposase